MPFPVIIEMGLDEAGTAVAVIVHPERGAAAIIEYANHPFAAAMRLEHAEVTGSTVQQFLDLVGKAECREQLLQSIRFGVPIQLDLPLVSRGAESWLGLRISFPSPGVSGVRNAIMIGRDITAARRNATQEDKMRQMLAQIFMRISSAVMIAERTGGLMMCNTAFRQLTKYSAEELKQLRAQDLIPADLIAARSKASEDQFNDGKPYEMDTEILIKGGHRVAVRMTSALLSDNDQQYRVVTMLPRATASDGGRPKAPMQAAETAAVQAWATRDKGELRAISLEALRSLFGDDWERISVRAMLRAEQVIRKRLGRDDIVSRVDDSNFVLWFCSDDRQRNETTLETILRDVRLNFLTEFGEEVASHVSATLVPRAQPPPAPSTAKKIAPLYAKLQKSNG